MWLQSYLSHRHQFTDFDGSVSDIGILSTGVPQRSIFGPLLFILYMSDTPIVSKKKSILYCMLTLQIW